ncbi:S9 family peptidase [Achromobacter sp. NPDC058515]|uniref:S9 family peptidase n=1 Tax=Achromobacter sp. NPDC058515 TaxID=3346533 RepID=UPI003669CAAB
MTDFSTEQTVARTDIPIADLIDLRETRSQALAPDGGLMACISNRSGLPQIWFCDPDGGNMRQATDLPERVDQIAFSPKNRDLLFTTDVGMDERFQLWLLPQASGQAYPLTSAPGVVHKWGAWKPCGTQIAWTANDRDPYLMDVVVMDLATGQTERVRKGAGFQEVLAWTPDGGSLILRDSTRGTADQDLLLLSLQTGEVRPFLPRAGRTIFRSVKLHKDGSGAFVLCDQARDFHAVQWLDFAEQRVSVLASIEGHDIDAFALTPDHARMALAVNRDGYTTLMATGDTLADLREIALPFAGVATSLACAPDGDLLATLESPVQPPSVWRCNPATGRCTQVTPPVPGKVDLRSLAMPEPARLASFDGTVVPYLVYPPMGEKPAAGWPVLFIVHGGPEMQWLPNFRADVQHYLSRGIMVIAPNVRGSTGYGRPYHQADDAGKRMDAVGDLLELARAIAARPDVDASRIGVMGQSYGGFMVLAALTEAPELWRTGVDIYGISNFTTLMETTGPWRRAMRAAEYGDPVRDAGFLASISPVHALRRVRAPLLVVHCADDPRVPPEQGEQVFSRLRGLGYPVEILRVPHEGHGFSRVSSKQRAYGTVAAWLANTL